MRHAVLGAGGIGGLVGAALARQGHEVTLLVRPEAVRDHPRRLQVESAVLGDFEADVLIAEHLDFQPDLLWITVKATQLEAALPLAPPGVLGAGLVLPLLNGIDHVARLRAVFGDRVLPGVIRVESERVGRGSYRQPTPFAALEVSASATPELESAAAAVVSEVAAAGLACRLHEDELTMLWGKLAGLAAMALTSTALERPAGAVSAEPEGRRLLHGVAAEAVLVANAEGAQIELDRLLVALDALPPMMRSSMQKDRAAGRPLELEAIGGPILRGGRSHGIPTPITAELMERLKGL